MAYRDDIRERTKKLNPRILELSDQIDTVLREQGYDGNIVELTEDMTPEEEELELFAEFLKEGYPEDIAALKAKETLALMERIFGKNK